MDHFKNPYAGTEGQLFALIKGLQERNITTELAVFSSSEYTDSGQLPCKVSDLNISKMLQLSTLFKIAGLARYCRQNQFKLVHIYFNDASVIAPIILRLFGLKVIISRRDMGYWYNSKLLKILRLNAGFHQGCICNSEAVKKITVEQEHILQQKAYVVCNGMPDNKIPGFDSQKITEQYTQHQIGLVANIRPIKRMQDLIKAMKLVRQEVADVNLIIVGGGDEPASLQLLAKEYGVDDVVTFAGAQEKVSDYIKQFQIAVLCSQSEGLSNAIMEYMAHQKPVICSDVGGNSELVEHGVNGYLYPAGDIKLLAKYLIELLQNTEKSITLGKNGYNKIINNFTMNNMVNSTIDVYNEII